MKTVDIAKLLIVAEEVRPNVNVSDVTVKGLEKYRTMFMRYANEKLPLTLFEHEGHGIIEEFYVRSKSSDFSIALSIDGMYVEFPFSWLVDNSPYITNIGAITDDNGYNSVTVKDLEFTKNIKIVVEPLSNGVYIDDALIKVKLPEG